MKNYKQALERFVTAAIDLSEEYERIESEEVLSKIDEAYTLDKDFYEFVSEFMEWRKSVRKNFNNDLT